MGTLNTIFVQRTPDEEALTLFTRVIATVLKNQPITFNIHFNLQALNISIQCPANAVQDRPESSKAASIISQAHVNLVGIVAQVTTGNTRNIGYNSSEPWRTQ